jgi:cytoskeletal protein RodZ
MAHLSCPPDPLVFRLPEKGSKPRRKRLPVWFIFRVCLISGLIILAACGGASVLSSAKAVSISASPSTATVVSGKTQQLTATVSNTSNTTVAWAATSGTVSASGLFTAPMVASSIQVNVTATSQADSRQSATVALTVNPAATVPGSPVAPPVPLAPVPAAPVPHSVSLAWRGAGTVNVVSYSLYRSTISGGSYGLLASALGTASYDDQSVQPATIYYYVVTAVDDQGRESVFSNETRASVP